MRHDPVWIAEARKYIGQAEIKGPHHNPHVLKWWKDMGAPFADDETAWCGAFIGGTFVETGLKPVTGGASARAWLKLPVELDKPAVGAVVVFWRGSRDGWQGHVGYILGQDQHGNLMVLGGNQGDTVSVKPFDRARVLGYRWPGIYPYEQRFILPIIGSNGKVSVNEA